MGLQHEGSGESSAPRQRSSLEVGLPGPKLSDEETIRDAPPDHTVTTSRKKLAIDSTRLSPEGLPIDSVMRVSDYEIAETGAASDIVLSLPCASDSIRADDRKVEKASFSGQSSSNRLIDHCQDGLTDARPQVESSAKKATAASPTWSRQNNRHLERSSATKASIQQNKLVAPNTRATRPGSQLHQIEAKKKRDFVRPRPKLPTKPTHLPASLTAQTVSSVSKVQVSPKSISCQGETRQSQNGSLQFPKPHKASKRGIAVNTFRTPDPSLGPRAGKSHQASLTGEGPSNVEQKFLERMTRPTQASSSRRSDRSPLTPPKKTVKLPHNTQRGNHSNQKLSKSTSNPSLPSRRKPVVQPPGSGVRLSIPIVATATTDDSVGGHHDKESSANEEKETTESQAQNEVSADLAVEQAVLLSHRQQEDMLKLNWTYDHPHASPLKSDVGTGGKSDAGVTIQESVGTSQGVANNRTHTTIAAETHAEKQDRIATERENNEATKQPEEELDARSQIT